ncbi:MAG: OmpA family protein [Cyclobacteriaceae bacterium]|nr:OmpA family protein [Cyclobacteriaceae bacterium]MCX7638453.1 OmpA family protein [Cyclobacteriaceae bacterium]MDW8331192.1 OmpA family protein [Cyclobacteriaceae bacterium]
MLKRNVWLWLAITAIPLSVNVFAQPALSTKSKKAIELYNEADNYRVRAQYTEAINLLKQAIAKDKNFAEAYHRMGQVYMAIRQYEEAIAVFEQALRLTSDVRKKKESWYSLGEACLLKGKYTQAREALTQFLQNETQNRQRIDQASRWLASANYALEHAHESGFKIRVLSDTVNQFATQYFPVLTADQRQLIFTRRLGFGAEHDEDLVVCVRDEKGNWSFPKSLSKNINSSLNEGTCTISADGRKLIFTSCVGRQSYGSCDLYESTKTGEEWSAPKNLGPMVNSADWESQPSLSADGRTLYFVSDRRGGQGRRDIWVSELDDAGNWTRARNLGPPVNTPGDEVSPYIHVNNLTLYFASTGHPGYGGFDIFYSEKTTSGWTVPVNMDKPLNNHEDQFSLYISPDGTKGYYSHEEMTQQGARGRIYTFSLPTEKQVKLFSSYVYGTVTDRVTGKPLKARIELFDVEKNERIAVVNSDSVTGKYLMVLTRGAEYALYVSREGYIFRSLNFNYTDPESLQKAQEPVEQNIILDPIQAGSVTVLKNIFFDTDSYELKEKSITELERVIRFLKENPTVRIEISGHTDNTGQPAYNQKLSENRALSVYNYLVSNNIDKSRILSRGYGQTQPIASNETPEGRQQNRRIEFRVLEK